MKTTEECYKWIKSIEHILLDIFGHTKDIKDYLDCIKMYLGTYNQIQWERDVAISQLNELGYQFGEKIKD